MRLLLSLKKALSFFIFRPFCIECRFFLSKESFTGLFLCQSCLDSIQPLVSKQLFIANSAITVHALGNYLPPLTTLIRSKNTGVRSLTLQLAELMARSDSIKNLSFDCVAAVPMHWTKKIYRGFNQAEEIAQYISKEKHIPFIKGIVKHKKTAHQSSLDRMARSTNLTGAFALNNGGHSFKGKHVLLIDDVMTTGSTIIEVARTIFKAGPASITVFVGARVID